MTDPATLLRYFAELAPAGRTHNLNMAPAPGDIALIDGWSMVPEPVPAPARAVPPVAQRGMPSADVRSASVEWHRSALPPTRTLRWTVSRGYRELGIDRTHVMGTGRRLDRLLRLERLHAHEHLLRMGWLFLTGTITVDGETQRVWVPLAEAPARLMLVDEMTYTLTIDREFEMPASVFEMEVRDALEDELTDLASGVFSSRRTMANFNPATDPAAVRWINRAASALGMERPLILAPGSDPMAAPEHNAVAPTIAVYTARDVDAPNLATTLLAWAARDVGDAAFAGIYGLSARTRSPQARAADVLSPMPLNNRQRDAVVAARRQDVTVVSGPPGTGKTHVAAAIAIDTVAQGGSVLVCAQSDHAIEALVELLERYPGPRWVRFGSRSHLDRVADELSGGRPARRTSAGSDDRDRALGDARREAEEVGRRVHERLAAEQDFAAALVQRDRLGWSVDLPPGLDPTAVDWDEVAGDVSQLRRPVAELADWFRRWWSTRRFTARFGPPTARRLEQMDDVIEWGRAEATIARVLDRGGVTLSDIMDQLAATEEAVRHRMGDAIAYRREAAAGSLSDEGRSVAALATSLRAGAATRRRLLRETRARDFLNLLPLWVGTLSEVDDTLPMEPAMFDLVILDEASQINQIRAAAALSRGARCVVVGDPRQLRHVSFVADRSMRDAAVRHGLEPQLATVADVRRNSAFDVAAGSAAVVELDEHFRSVPHIIGFSNRVFYGGRLRLMTVHPSNERHDAIDVVRVPGARDDDGVNRAEVDAILEVVAQAAADGSRTGTLGILTPFRAQADAVETAMLDAFDVDTIDRLGLRVGTVHGFQGAERDATIITLGVGADPSTQALRFVQDPNLFNVMVTRARRHITLVTSVGNRDDLAEGLLKAYLRHSEHPPRPAETGVVPGGWVGTLASRLEGYGLRVVAEYPVAGYTVDLAVGDDDRAVAVECVVHPDGPEAHIERHLTLRRAGWRIVDAFESRWLARPDAAVDRIVESVLRPATR